MLQFYQIMNGDSVVRIQLIDATHADAPKPTFVDSRINYRQANTTKAQPNLAINQVCLENV